MSSSEQFVGVLALFFLAFLILVAAFVGLVVYILARLIWVFVRWVRKKRSTYVVVC
jgi:hypothetical protein